MPPACSGEQLEEKEFVLQEVSCKNFLDPDGDFRNFDKNFPVGLLKYDSRYPEKFLGRFFPKKNDFIVFRLWKIKIWASWEYSPSSTEFYVSRGTFWGKIFLTENIPSLFVFRVRLKTYPNFGENLSAMSSNLHFMYRKKHLEERCFFSKIWSLYTSHKKLRTLSKTNSVFGENLPSRLSRLHFMSSDDNFKKISFS